MSVRELVVLGTASQVPSRRRNHNGYLLRWDGEGLLFDPGEIVMLHRATGMVLCLQQHHTNQGEPADPSRTGADHIAFRVASRAELDNWAQHLAALGVRQSSIADRDYGAVLCLRDPDEFQLELFYRENHP